MIFCQLLNSVKYECSLKYIILYCKVIDKEYTEQEKHRLL